MSKLTRPSRRQLLRIGWQSMAVAGALPALRAQSAGGHRALVCLYLSGGNDSNNLIVPLDPPGYAAYAAARGPLALPANRLIPITTRGQASYGLHPALSELAGLYGKGKMAVVANVGDPRLANRTRNHATATPMSYLRNGFLTPPWARRWADTTGSGAGLYTFESGVSMLAPGAPLYGSGIHENSGMRLAIDSAASTLRFPDTGIGLALRDAAGLVSIGPSWGMARQVLTVPFSGFDTHTDQLRRQHRLFRDLSQAVAAFYRAAESMNIGGSIALYTDSEFSRALAPNSRGGSEHGWGGHQLVIGGSVRGGDVYGEFPAVGSAVGGMWAPTVTRAQYAAELASWAGAATDGPRLGIFG